MKLTTHQPSFCTRLLPLLAAAPLALLIGQGEAKAILTVRIFDDGPNLTATVQGSLSQLPSPIGGGSCGPSLFGQFSPDGSFLCTGQGQSASVYPMSGPPGYGGNNQLFSANATSGYAFRLGPSTYTGTVGFRIDDTYVLGQSFLSSATFNGTSLAAQGFTATGLVGTWTIDGTSETINVCLGSGPCPTSSSSSVPGPLPLVGAGAAFGWSRRLRRRIAAPAITHPKA